MLVCPSLRVHASACTRGDNESAFLRTLAHTCSLHRADSLQSQQTSRETTYEIRQYYARHDLLDAALAHSRQRTSPPPSVRVRTIS